MEHAAFEEEEETPWEIPEDIFPKDPFESK